MLNSSLKTLLLTAAIAMVSTSASAKDDDKKTGAVAVCALSDLTAATACSGYFAGNLNGGSPDMIATAQSALKTLGYAWDGDMATVEKIERFDGKEVEFALPLTGINFVSIHYGAGKGPDKVAGGTTGFYKVDAADGLFTLETRFGSLSNAILYLKPTAIDGGSDFAASPDLGGTSGAVPEPAVWMQLILGFGLVGFYRRRQQQKHVTA
jgi:PEP-CTERM motif